MRENPIASLRFKVDAIYGLSNLRQSLQNGC